MRLMINIKELVVIRIIKQFRWDFPEKLFPFHQCTVWFWTVMPEYTIWNLWQMQEIIVSFSKSFPHVIHMPPAQRDCDIMPKSDGCQKASWLSQQQDEPGSLWSGIKRCRKWQIWCPRNKLPVSEMFVCEAIDIAEHLQATGEISSYYYSKYSYC